MNVKDFTIVSVANHDNSFRIMISNEIVVRLRELASEYEASVGVDPHKSGEFFFYFIFKNEIKKIVYRYDHQVQMFDNEKEAFDIGMKTLKRIVPNI